MRFSRYLLILSVDVHGCTVPDLISAGVNIFCVFSLFAAGVIKRWATVQRWHRLSLRLPGLSLNGSDRRISCKLNTVFSQCAVFFFFPLLHLLFIYFPEWAPILLHTFLLKKKKNSVAWSKHVAVEQIVMRHGG